MAAVTLTLGAVLQQFFDSSRQRRELLLNCVPNQRMVHQVIAVNQNIAESNE